MIKQNSTSCNTNFNLKPAIAGTFSSSSSVGYTSKMYLPKVIPSNTLRVDSSIKNHLFRIDSTSIISSYQTFRKLQMDVQNIDVGCQNYHLRSYNTPMIEDFTCIKPFSSVTVGSSLLKELGKEVIPNEIKSNNSHNNFLLYKAASRLNESNKSKKSASKHEIYSSVVSNNSKIYSSFLDSDQNLTENSQSHTPSNLAIKRIIHFSGSGPFKNPKEILQAPSKKCFLSKLKVANSSTIRFKLIQDSQLNLLNSDLIEGDPKAKETLQGILLKKKEFESMVRKYIKRE